MARSLGNQPGVIPDGAKIEDLRIRRGLSRGQLSQMTFLKPNTIQKIELYDMKVSLLAACRIANALGVEREDILKEPEALASLDAENGPVAANDRANRAIRLGHRITNRRDTTQ